MTLAVPMLLLGAFFSLSNLARWTCGICWQTTSFLGGTVNPIITLRPRLADKPAYVLHYEAGSWAGDMTLLERLHKINHKSESPEHVQKSQAKSGQAITPERLVV